jgi:starch-binding outer membrane protein SusE/F
MKKTIKYILAFVVGCMAFTSCEDPYANQTVAKPGSYDQLAPQDTTGFVAAMKQASVIILPANLNDSLTMITCTSVPTFADPLAKASYKLQFSNTADFASYHVIPFTFNGKSGSDFKVSYKDLNDTLFFMNSTSGQRDVYARVFAYGTKGGLKTLIKAITLKFQATPVPLKAYTDVTPRPWYIVGLGGHWDNNVAGLGSSLIPLSVVVGKNYNDLGDGKFVYTGYFKSSDGFKILRNIGNWDNDIWGMTGSSYVYNGGGNISVAADGYYTITLNSITNTLTIVSASAPTASYTSIGLIGGFNSWGSDVIMTPAQTTNNHIWYTTQTFATDGGCKFRADGAWTTSWGGDSFPIGMSGGDIPAKAGTYKVLFNDIDGCFYFIKQ